MCRRLAISNPQPLIDVDTTSLVSFLDLNPPRDDFSAAVINGLSEEIKAIPCKFFYDERGSQLFDQICELPEYYPTRTEISILEEHLGEIAELVGRSAHLVELGSGASAKIRILLNALNDLAQYTAIDISREYLLTSANQLADDYPNLDVAAVCADYTTEFEISAPKRKRASRNVGFFPGSTIGNFSPDNAQLFLKRLAKSLGKGSGLLIGVDLKKDPAIIRAAYNDDAGLTAAFNLNLLTRINTELNGDFDLSRFEHEALYIDKRGSVELALISKQKQLVRVGDHSFNFAEGEAIHTEDSYKYSIAEFRKLCENAGYLPIASWTDRDSLFSVHYFTAE